MVENVKKSEERSLGAMMPARIADRFQARCKKKKDRVVQKDLLPNLIDWWLRQSIEIQEHIYRARFADVAKCIVLEYQAKQDHKQAQELQDGKRDGRRRSEPIAKNTREGFNDG